MAVLARAAILAGGGRAYVHEACNAADFRERIREWRR